MKSPTYYFLEGNSCTGSTGRLKNLGLNIIASDYFGNVASIKEFTEYAIAEMSTKIDPNASIVIVGSSFGGHLALYLINALADHALLKRITGVVLTGTPPAGTPERISKAFNVPKETIEPGGRSVLELLAAPDVMTEAEALRFVLPAFGDPDNSDPDHTDHKNLIAENIKNVTTNAAMGKTRNGILSNLTMDEIELAKNLVSKTKLMFIHAAKDPVISQSYVEEVARDLNAPLKIIDGYHYAHWSNAREFADIIAAFANQ